MSDTAIARTTGGAFATSRRGSIAADLDFIQAKRRAGFPDSAIARMIGRSVDDVRTVPGEPPRIVRAAPKIPAREPKPTVVLSLFKGLIRTRVAPEHGMADICAEIAAKRGVTVDDLLGRSHARRAAWPRQEAYWAIYRTGGYTLPQIGRFFGGRDHTTVLAGIRAHEGRLAGGYV